MTFKDLNNLYEVRRTIRFELFRKGTTYIDTPSKVDSKDRMQTIYRKLQDLVSTYKEFISLWGNTIFKQDDDARKKIEFFPDESKGQDIDELINTLECNKTVLFKFSGIEKTFKDDRFKNKDSFIKRNKKGLKTKNHMTIDSGNFLDYYFRQRIKDNIALSRELEKFSAQQNNLRRFSDLSFSVGLLQTQKYLKKLFILFEGDYIDHKSDTEVIPILYDQLIDIEDLVRDILDITKPSQSLGLPIEYVTLNYYTRNKTPKEYDDEIENKELALNKPYTGFDQNTKLYGIDRNASIEFVYRQMKEFKAREKSAFFERLQKKVQFTALNDSFDYIDNKGDLYKDYVLQLFSNQNDITENDYKSMLSLTEIIQSTETTEDQKKTTKVARGINLLGKRDNNKKKMIGSCQNYINFCENYKKIAMEYGKRKAEVNSLKREKLEAEKRRNWGFFIERDGKYSLITILSDRSNDAFQGIKNDLMLGSNEKPNVRYFILSSITLRALDKLCFAKNSTFAKNIRNKIDQQFLGEYNMKSKTALKEEKILLDFYNEILNRQTSLDLRWRSENSQQILRGCRTEDEFEIVLKQETYVMKELQTTETKMQQFLEKYTGEEYEISSWDLRGKGSTLTQDGNGERDHEENFTQWRKSFWSNENKNEKYPIRVNPEMTISFVERNQEFVEKYNNQTNNRKSRDRLLLTATISYYADKSYIDGGFIDNQERKENNINFSKLYNQEKGTKLKYFYGLDRGVNELVTLGIFEKGTDNKIKSVKLDGVEIYKITDEGLSQTKEVVNKDGTKKIHTLYKNPSMFIDKISDPTVFEKLPIESCIGNLTCAKVIDGKIILNGDINTLKKLYEINAKRFLFLATKEQGRTGTKIEYNPEEELFYCEIGEKKRAIYYLENVNNIVSKDEIEQMLNEYIAHIDDQDISIAKINHLRNAICANIVGVIMKLQEEYPGYIVWENITISDDNKHSISSHTNLGNLIVEKIYNKLHFLKEVPPILKKFRSDIKANLQHGKVLYINKDETSSLCPCCGGKLGGHLTEFENTMKHFSDEEYDATYNDMAYPKFKKENTNDNGKRNNRWGAQQIDLKKCTFQIGEIDSNFGYLKSGDDLATYNIAKRGQEFLQSDRYKNSIDINLDHNKEDNVKQDNIKDDEDNFEGGLGYNPFKGIKF